MKIFINPSMTLAMKEAGLWNDQTMIENKRLPESDWTAKDVVMNTTDKALSDHQERKRVDAEYEAWQKKLQERERLHEEEKEARWRERKLERRMENNKGFGRNIYFKRK